MITIYTTARPFVGHYAVIQRNAIQSWRLLSPDVQIILLGNDEGYQQVAREFHCEQISDVEVNEFGTPLLRSMFEKAEECASYDLCCFINADLILFEDFYHSLCAVRQWVEKRTKFVLIGRRWNLDVDTQLNFNPREQAELRKRALISGALEGPGAIDFFVYYPKRLWGTVPDFTPGRAGLDWWLLWEAKSRGSRIVDITRNAFVIHQNHDYKNIAQLKGPYPYHSPEGEKNTTILRGEKHRGRTTASIYLASHKMENNKISRAYGWQYVKARFQFYPFVNRLLSYTHPIRRRLGLTETQILQFLKR
jgi:hypothetical protein